MRQSEYYYRTKPQGEWFGPFKNYKALLTDQTLNNRRAIEVDVRGVGQKALTPEQEEVLPQVPQWPIELKGKFLK